MLATLKYFFTGGTAHVILEYEPEDLASIAEIHAQSFSRAWGEDEFEKMLARKPYACLVARRAGTPKREISGFVIFRQAADEAEIITIAVRKKMRKRGIASHLIDEMVRLLQADRASKLFLEVDETNKNAVKLYRQSGFVETGKRDGYYAGAKGKRPSPALVMQRELG